MKLKNNVDYALKRHSLSLSGLSLWQIQVLIVTMLQGEYDLRVRRQESFMLAHDEHILCMLSFLHAACQNWIGNMLSISISENKESLLSNCRAQKMYVTVKKNKRNFNNSMYRHLQKCLYKGLCPKLSTNTYMRNCLKNSGDAGLVIYVIWKNFLINYHPISCLITYFRVSYSSIW